MLCPPLKRPRIVEDWLDRHRHPGNLLLHIVGIPLTLAGFLLTPIFVCLFSLPVLVFSLSLFVVGYLLQFLGHAVDGTVPGELLAVKRWWESRGATAGAAGRSVE
jgi:uncharacterized membrane protein YGL010W